LTFEERAAWKVVAVFEATVVSSFCFVFFSVALEVGFEETGADVTAEAALGHVRPGLLKLLLLGWIIWVMRSELLVEILQARQAKRQICDVGLAAWALLVALEAEDVSDDTSLTSTGCRAFLLPGRWSSPFWLRILDCFESEVGRELCFQELELILQNTKIVDFVEGEDVLTQNQVIKTELEMALGLQKLHRTCFSLIKAFLLHFLLTEVVVGKSCFFQECRKVRTFETFKQFVAFPSQHKDAPDFLILQQKRIRWLDLNILISFKLLMILLTNRPRIKQR
jgi:hypothetical protein